MSTPKVLLAGIDGLEIGFCIDGYRWGDEVWHDLAQAKELARQDDFSKDSGAMDFQGKQMVVCRSGIPRYMYMLKNKDIKMLLSDKPRGGKHYPEVRIRFSAVYLWRNGWLAAAREVEAWINGWAEVAGQKISRMDPMADMAMALPKLSPGLREVVTRARKKGEKGSITFEYGRNVEGLNESGHTFGRGHCSLIIYDKVREIRTSSNKTWFYPLWKQACPELDEVCAETWHNGPAMTRFEFHCKRPLLKEFGIDSIDDLEGTLPDLWQYLTEKWLMICRPNKEDRNRSRWQPKGFWRTLQGVRSRFGEIAGVVRRIRQIRPPYNQLEAQTIGLVKSLVAWCSLSVGGGNLTYGKRFVENRLMRALHGPPGTDPGILTEFDHAVLRREHLYASMSQ